MYAAQKVLGDMTFMQSLDQLRNELEAKVGRQIAEGIEGPTLYKDSQYTDWRLGGGSLMASVLLGLGAPNLGKTGGRYVAVNQVERPHTGGGGPDKTPDRPIDPKKPHVPLRVVEIDSGGKGAWNKELNKPQPNTIYKVDGNKVYQTDSLGRVEKVEADLSGIVRDRNKYQQCQTGKCGLDADEGGHLIASIMDGPGERINMVPMDGNLNKGAWKKMENIWAKAVDEGKSVKVEIQPVYGGAGVRPDSFVVTYRIGNKQEVREAYVNAPGGK